MSQVTSTVTIICMQRVNFQAGIFLKLYFFCFCLFITSEETSSSINKEVKGRTHTYYQVLIDSRDVPHIVSTINFRTFTY